MKEGEPTIGEVIDEFLDTVVPTKNCTMRHIGSTMNLLQTSISREWSCIDCEYWEAPGDGYKSAWCTTHGIGNIGGEIRSFCSYFIIRKCLMSEGEKRQCYLVMSKFADFMFKKKHIDEKVKKDIKNTLTQCRAVNSEKICRALYNLKEQGYWKSLEQQPDDEDENDSDSEDDVSYAEDTFGSDLPLEVAKVTDEGWIFAYQDGYDEDSCDGVLLRLPPDVAKLGQEGMEISCMNLMFRRGVWSPYNPYDSSGNRVCANVYPGC